MPPIRPAPYKPGSGTQDGSQMNAEAAAPATSIEPGVVASGAGEATRLSATTSVIAGGPAGGGVALPRPKVGWTVNVLNQSGASKVVYPFGNEKINGLGSVDLPDRRLLTLFCAGDWVGGDLDSGTAQAAILLESGGASRISDLPGFDLALPPDGTEQMPVVEARETRAITLAQLYTLFANWLATIAANPLDAPVGSGADGAGIALTAGAGDGAGNGGSFNLSSGGGARSGDVGVSSHDDAKTGNVFVGSGAASAGDSGFFAIYSGAALGGTSGSVFVQSGDSDTDVGPVLIQAGAFIGANGDGGDVQLLPGSGAGTGRNGLVLATLPTSDPGVSGALWDNLGIVTRSS